MVAHHDHQQLPQQGEQARKGMQEKLSGQRLAGGCDEDDEDLTDAATCWWPTFEGPGVSSFKGSSFKDAKNLKQLWSDQHDCVEADKTNWQHVQQKDDQIA